MAGPPVYEASIPFFRKALRNQLSMLERGRAWANEHNDADNTQQQQLLTRAVLAPGTPALSFHVEFSTFNAASVLDDLGIALAGGSAAARVPEPAGEELSLAQMMARVEETLRVLELARPEEFVGKEGTEVVMDFGDFTLRRGAMACLHEITVPSFWFHHTMVYAILMAHGVPLNKMDYLSAW